MAVQGLKRHSGLLLGLTGWLHTVVGIFLLWGILGDIVEAGVFNAVEPHFDRGAAVWFLFSGFFMLLLAYLMGWVIKEKGMELPRALAWYLLALSVLGIILMPISGFWLALPQVWIILSRRKN
jgi:hypothetical protein